jgi:iron complex outermembrane recepter protein
MVVATFLFVPWPAAAQPTAPLPPGVAAGTSTAAEPGPGAEAGKKILDMDIGELAKTPVVTNAATGAGLSMDTPVTSVSKQESTIGHSAAAIFVITPEMIRRSGATCIPEALRMAPGLEVARVDQNKWAISSRGFNARYDSKLLVLIDGRTVYTPVFSGVYWDTQDVLLEDVERIEVIRGPGGTLWGSNAVNGVINVITKKAKDTQGAYVMAGGGTEEKMTDGVRYGGRIGDDGHYRVYGKHFDRGTGWVPDSVNGADDAWRQGRAGFRADWDLDRAKRNSLTVQGDSYVGDSGVRDTLTTTLPPFMQSVVAKDHVSGENVLTRWRHTNDDDSEWALQTYFDQYDRDGPLELEQVKTYDLDFQYRFALTSRQRIIWGLGFRHQDDCVIGANYFTLHYDPPRRGTNLTGGFIQDEIALVEERLALTLGTKLEENDFTGLEVQPSVRLLWTPDKRHSAWAAISRAVRTPSLTDESLVVTWSPAPGSPDLLRVMGTPGIKSEDLLAYEIGYREQMTERFSWDLALFYNVYRNLIGLDMGQPFVEPVPPPPHTIIPGVLSNDGDGETYGVELAANWRATDRWQLYSQYTFLQLLAHGGVMPEFEGMSPHHQVYLRSAWDIGRNLEFDLMGRYVDYLPDVEVPSYITMDLRLGWRPRERLELAVVGQNLLQDHHREFGSEIRSRVQVTEVPRGVYGTATWRY